MYAPQARFQIVKNDWDLGEISCSGDYLDFNNFESFSFKKQDGTK